jgi:hypothetical protein
MACPIYDTFGMLFINDDVKRQRCVSRVIIIQMRKFVLLFYDDCLDVQQVK